MSAHPPVREPEIHPAIKAFIQDQTCEIAALPAKIRAGGEMILEALEEWAKTQSFHTGEDTGPVLCTLRKAAAQVGVCYNTLRKWRKAGYITSNATPGGVWLVDIKEIRALLAALGDKYATSGSIADAKAAIVGADADADDTADDDDEEGGEDE
jgi:hypothetical protein